MYFNLIEILDNDGFKLDFCEKVNPLATEFRGADLSFPEGISLSGYVKNLHGAIEFYSKINTTVLTKCARCFKDAQYSFSFDYSDEVNKHREADDGIILEGTSVNLEDIALKAVISELPIQILCNENCKGLCPKCGADLNETTCNCPGFEPDSRWDILKNLNLKDEV